MTCASTHADAVAGSPRSASGHHPAIAGQPSGRAENTAQQPSNGSLTDMLQSHAAKNFPHNDLKRRRMLDLHRTLARLTCSGGSHD